MIQVTWSIISYKQIEIYHEQTLFAICSQNSRAQNIGWGRRKIGKSKKNRRERNYRKNLMQEEIEMIHSKRMQ